PCRPATRAARRRPAGAGGATARGALPARGRGAAGSARRCAAGSGPARRSAAAAAPRQEQPERQKAQPARPLEHGQGCSDAEFTSMAQKWRPRRKTGASARAGPTRSKRAERSALGPAPFGRTDAIRLSPLQADAGLLAVGGLARRLARRPSRRAAGLQLVPGVRGDARRFVVRLVPRRLLLRARRALGPRPLARAPVPFRLGGHASKVRPAAARASPLGSRRLPRSRPAQSFADVDRSSALRSATGPSNPALWKLRC